MQPLATLPVFLRLAGAPVVLAGDGDPAAWKAELLAATGADLRLYSPSPSLRLRETAERLRLTLRPRGWREADLAGARLAVAEARDADEAARFRAAAKAAGALVNVIDRPEFCDVSFGSIVERSPLVIGVSTDGAAPVFAQAVRARIEAMVPDALRAWAQAARAWRPRLAGLETTRRRAVWLDFADRAFSSVDRAPNEADVLALSRAERKGRLIVVGTGTGAPEDLTQRAVRALQAADHLIFDGPVNEALRDLGRREATFESWPEGADESVHSAAFSGVGRGETVVALVPGEGTGTEWSRLGADLVRGLAP